VTPHARRPALASLSLAFVAICLAAFPSDGVAAQSTGAPSSIVGTGLVWGAGMETGNLAEWTESWDSGLCTRPPNGVSTDVAHSGRYSMAMTIDTSQGDAGCRQARIEESRSGRPYHYGAWLYVPAYTAATDYWNIVQFKSKRAGASGSDPFWVLDVMPRPGGALALRLRWKGLVAGPFGGDGTAPTNWSDPPVDVPVGRWFHLEVYLRQSAVFDGRVTVWQDGIELWDLVGVKTRYEDGDQRWTVNNYSDALTPSPATLYVDDATIAINRVYPSGRRRPPSARDFSDAISRERTPPQVP
jgi:hypothetical protein